MINKIVMLGLFAMALYVPTFSQVTIPANLAITLGDIMMRRKITVMKEATVNGQKQLIEISGEKVIMNLTGNSITAGLNGLELLEKLPGVTVNRQSEEIQMNGKTGVLLMVDGRQTYLSGQQLSNFLKTLRSDDIEKVEIISNPSARYEAAAANGIINLKTKKNRSDGTNFTLDAGLRYGAYSQYGDYPQNSQGFAVGIRRGRFSLYANLNRNHVREFWANDNAQNLINTSGSVIEQRMTDDLEKGRYESWTTKINLDYTLSRRSTAGVSFSGNFFDGHRDGDLLQVSGQPMAWTNIHTIYETSDRLNSYILNSHWGHNFDTSGTQLMVDVDILFNRTFRQTGFNSSVSKSGIDSIGTNETSNHVRANNYILTANFEKKLGRRIKLEMGLKSRFAVNKNDHADNFLTNGPLVASFFQFNENLDGSYLMLSDKLNDKTEVQAGIRAEQTDNKGLDSNGNRLTGEDYLNFFPSLIITRRLSKNNSITLSYSRRINRPGSTVFNTFRNFSSDLTYFEGNPALLASLYNSYSLSDLIKKKYFIELAYVNVQRFYTGTFDIDSTLISGRYLVKNSLENIVGKVSWWNLKVLLPLEIAKWWAFNLQLWSGVNVYNYQREDAHVDTAQFYWGASVQQNFNLPGALTLQIGARINSGQTSGFQTSRPSGALDIGFRKSILQHKGSLRLSLQDPFNFNYSRTIISGGDLTGNGEFRWNSRMLIAGFTYTFGSRNVNLSKWSTKYRDNNAEEKN